MSEHIKKTIDHAKIIERETRYLDIIKHKKLLCEMILDALSKEERDSAITNSDNLKKALEIVSYQERIYFLGNEIASKEKYLEFLSDMQKSVAK